MVKLVIFVTFLVAFIAFTEAKTSELNTENKGGSNIKAATVQIVETNMASTMKSNVISIIQNAYNQYPNNIARVEAISTQLGFYYNANLWSVLNDAIAYSVMQQYYALAKVNGVDNIYIHGIKNC